MDWIGLDQDRDRWRTVLSAVMRWAGHVALMGEEMGCRGSCGETGGKDTTGKT